MLHLWNGPAYQFSIKKREDCWCKWCFVASVTKLWHFETTHVALVPQCSFHSFDKQCMVSIHWPIDRSKSWLIRSIIEEKIPIQQRKERQLRPQPCQPPPQRRIRMNHHRLFHNFTYHHRSMNRFGHWQQATILGWTNTRVTIPMSAPMCRTLC